MKDSKAAKTNAKKKTNSTPKKVKDVEFRQLDDDFSETDTEDKRLIVFIALAILVIVGTIIGLLVGCQKEEKDEPKKPEDDIVVPEKEDNKKEDKESYNYDYEKPLPVVRKVTKKTTKASTEESTDNTSTEETTKHNVTFYLNEESEVVEVEDGSNASEYTPTGYTDCKYYVDEEMSEEYDFTTSVNEDKNIYMVCSLITYDVVYVVNETESHGEYTVEDGNIALEDPTLTEGVFAGWYTDENYTNQVTALSKDILPTEGTQLYLYAKVTTGQDDVINPEEGKTEEDETLNEENLTEEKTTEENLQSSESELNNQTSDEADPTLDNTEKENQEMDQQALDQNNVNEEEKQLDEEETQVEEKQNTEEQQNIEEQEPSSVESVSETQSNDTVETTETETTESNETKEPVKTESTASQNNEESREVSTPSQEHTVEVNKTPVVEVEVNPVETEQDLNE